MSAVRPALVAGILLTSVIASPVAAAVVELDGCDVILAAPDDSVIVRLERDGDDGWLQEEVVDGIVDLTSDGTGQLAPGTWTATWENDEAETFVLDCPVQEGPPQDPSEADICQWLEPDEIVEECQFEVTAAGGDTTTTVSTTGTVIRGSSRDWLPETSTETSDHEAVVPLGTVIVLLAIASVGAAIGAYATRRPR